MFHSIVSKMQERYITIEECQGCTVKLLLTFDFSWSRVRTQQVDCFKHVEILKMSRMRKTMLRRCKSRARPALSISQKGCHPGLGRIHGIHGFLRYPAVVVT